MGTAARDAPVRLSGLSYETTKNIIALASGHIAPLGADPKDPALQIRSIRVNPSS